MYSGLVFLHSIWRWAVLISLVCSIATGFHGLYSRRIFGRWDNAARHWTATIAHIQLVLGIMLYTQSPLVKIYWRQIGGGGAVPDILFFAVIHALLMLGAIVLITVGSALAKRRPTNEESFRTMAVYFTIALILIIISIPWPFSPLAQRPLFP